MEFAINKTEIQFQLRGAAIDNAANGYAMRLTKSG